MKYTRQLNQRVKPHRNYECKKNPLMQEEMAMGEKDHINMIIVVRRELNWSSNKQHQSIRDSSRQREFCHLPIIGHCSPIVLCLDAVNWSQLVKDVAFQRT